MPQNDQALLVRLHQSGVPFVVIGGVCAVHHGAPVATFDLDICCPFGVENVKSIEAALADLHPVHRMTPNKLPLEATRDQFGQLKNLYLQTDLGKLDCLSEVLGIGSFEKVLGNSVEAKFSFGRFRFLSLDALIVAKEAAGRERDLAALRFLRPIREKLNQPTKPTLGS
jgi:hypothetical protein